MTFSEYLKQELISRKIRVYGIEKGETTLIPTSEFLKILSSIKTKYEGRSIRITGYCIDCSVTPCLCGKLR